MFADTFKVPIGDKAVEQHAPAALGSRHVRTTDLMLISNPALRSLLAQGLNHIPMVAADTQATVASNVSLAEQFMQRVVHPVAAALGYAVGPSWYETARKSAAAWTTYHLQGRGATDDELTDRTKEDLRGLQSSLLICEVDKAANTCCFLCPKNAQLLVLLRLKRSADFSRSSANPTAITAALREQMHSIDAKLAEVVQEGRLPLMRGCVQSTQAGLQGPNQCCRVGAVTDQ